MTNVNKLRHLLSQYITCFHCQQQAFRNHKEKYIPVCMDSSSNWSSDEAKW